MVASTDERHLLLQHTTPDDGGVGLTPYRRACSLCRRRESTVAMHLAAVYIDGVPARACDDCRREGSWFCQNPRCRREQMGRRHPVGALVYCAPCAALLASAEHPS